MPGSALAVTRVVEPLPKAASSQVERDLSAARESFGKAAAQSHILASYQLAKMFLHGLGGDQDVCAAAQAYKARPRCCLRRTSALVPSMSAGGGCHDQDETAGVWVGE